jgi:hypothetical protein
MKTLIQTIIVIVTFSLLAAPFAPAKNASNEESRDDLDINAREAEVIAVLAQAQTDQPVTPSPTPSIPKPAPASAPTVAPTPPTLPMSTGVEDLSRRLENLRTLSFGSRTGSSDMVLVIPTEQTSTEDLIAINEDMNVMSRIFETNLEQDRIATARSGIFISGRDPYGMFLGDSRGQIQSMYLQGYGALFLLKVDFPLSPSSDVQQEEKETAKEEEGDPVWKQMRREIYEPENVDRRRRPEKQEEKYNPEKVENLKTTLIKSLKHAANIRNLKPDESVVLTVTGSGEITGTKIIATNVSGNGQQVIVQEKSADGKTTMRIVNGKALDDIGLSSPTVLVIRVKSSEIDAYAKGELDFDKFRARVQVLTYPLLSKAVGNSSSSSRNIGLYDDFVR